MAMALLAAVPPELVVTAFQPIPSLFTTTTEETMMATPFRSRSISHIIVAGRGGGRALFATADDTKSSMTIPATTTTAMTSSSRRSILNFVASSILLPLAITGTSTPSAAAYATEENTSNNSDSMYAPKFVQTYEDFITMPEGWSYKDVKSGTGNNEWKDGDRLVFDWSGYTIGYFGRPFEAKG